MLNFSSDKLESQRQFIDQLRSLGLDSLLQLPTIAVMGDTSSGKSSVLSAISGIDFPTDSELCTRCPIQVAMQYDGLQCAKRRYSVRADGGTDGVGFERQTDNLADVGGLIGEATQFVLNNFPTPSRVSERVVNVSLRGPEYVDLTLIDLPGTVRTVGDGESPELPAAIDSILTKYRRNERCILLTVVPANVDFHNNECLQRAKEVDPDTVRTIPVVTKADLIPEGGEGGVLQLLQGRVVRFSRGFYIVRCRSLKEVAKGMTLQEAAEREKQFFANPPHASLAEIFQQFRASCQGIPSLRTALGDIYQEMMQQSVPTIAVQVKDMRAKDRDELTQLGPDLEGAGKKRAEFERISRAVASELDPKKAWGSSIRRPEADVYSFCTNFVAELEEADVYRCFQEEVEGENHKENRQLKRHKSMPRDTSKEEPNGTDKEELLRQVLRDTQQLDLSVFPSSESITLIVSAMVQRAYRAAIVGFTADVDSLVKKLVDRALAVVPKCYQGCRSFIKIHMEKAISELGRQRDESLREVVRQECVPLTFNTDLMHDLLQKRNYRLYKAVKRCLRTRLPAALPSSTTAVPSTTTALPSSTTAVPSTAAAAASTAVGAAVRSTTTAAPSTAASNEKAFSANQVLDIVEKAFQTQYDSWETSIANELSDLLDAYSQLAAKRVGDIVPQIVNQHFLQRLGGAVQSTLSGIPDSELSNIICLPANAERRRQELAERLKALELASEFAEKLQCSN